MSLKFSFALFYALSTPIFKRKLLVFTILDASADLDEVQKSYLVDLFNNRFESFDEDWSREDEIIGEFCSAFPVHTCSHSVLPPFEHFHRPELLEEGDLA